VAFQIQVFDQTHFQLLSTILIPDAVVTKVGARRGEDKSWPHALSRQELIDAVHDNLRNLGLEKLDVVNLRVGGIMEPSDESIEEPLTALAELKRQGLIRHMGVSNVSRKQLEEAQRITEIVCVQNFYIVAHRNDDGLIEDLAKQRIAYVPFFPPGGFSPLQSSKLDATAVSLQATPMQGRAGLAASALAEHSADSGDVFGQASSRKPQGCDTATSF
jgi:pyridoxine 4-dehydrogenase